MINRVVLVGRLTKDVEVRKTQSGLSVASFTVACDRRGAKEGDQKADFISCVAWRQSADYLGQYSGKGMCVAVEGRLTTRSYDRQDGTKAYVTEVQCDNVSICEKRTQDTNTAPKTYGNGYREEQSSRTDFSSQEAVNNAINAEFNITDADLPF